MRPDAPRGRSGAGRPAVPPRGFRGGSRRRANRRRSVGLPRARGDGRGGRLRSVRVSRRVPERSGEDRARVHRRRRRRRRRVRHRGRRPRRRERTPDTLGKIGQAGEDPRREDRARRDRVARPVVRRPRRERRRRLRPDDAGDHRARAGEAGGVRPGDAGVDRRACGGTPRPSARAGARGADSVRAVRASRLAGHVQREDGPGRVDGGAARRREGGVQARAGGAEARFGDGARGGVGGVARAELRGRGRVGRVRRVGRKLSQRSGRFQASRRRPSNIVPPRLRV